MIDSLSIVRFTTTVLGFDREIGFDHEDVLTLLAGLDGLGRDDDGIGLRRQSQARHRQTDRATVVSPYWQKVPLSKMVPVVLSIVLSMNVRTPLLGAPCIIWKECLDLEHPPLSIYFLISAKFCSGTEKAT